MILLYHRVIDLSIFSISFQHSADGIFENELYTEELTEAPTVTLKDVETETVVANTPVIEGNILHMHFTTPIVKNKEYILQIGDAYKLVVVKELFGENFNSEAVSTVSTAAINRTDWYSGAGNGTFIVNGSSFGGNNSNMLAITNSAFYIKKASVLAERDLTVSADVVLMKRKTSNPGGGISLRAKNNNYTDSYRLVIYRQRNELGIHDYTNTSSYGMIADTKLTSAHNSDDIAGVMNNGLTNLDYEITTQGKERAFVLRNYDNVIGAYYNGGYIGTVIDEDNKYSTTNQGVAFQSDTNSVMLIDNVSVTKCEVNDVEVGEVIPTGLSGDFNSLTLTFDKGLSGTKDFQKITVYEDDLLKDAEIKLDDDDKTKVVIIPEGYSAGHTYKVEVAEGFGTSTLYTYTAYNFTYNLEPQEISVTNAQMTFDNITITFDRADGWVKTEDKITVYKNDIEVSADITKNEDKLIIVPNGFVSENSYKVVLHQGFGGNNTYLFEDYEFSGELIKEEIKILDISGDSKTIEIEFNCDISEISDFTPYVSVTKDDVRQTAAYEATGNILKVKLDTLENDKVYELSVKDIETYGAILKTNVLKKVMLETQLFEDFEDDELCDGIEAGGSTIEYADGNCGRILWNAVLYVTKSDIINSEDVVLSYDYKLYNANLNNSDKAYTSSIPYSYWGYNLQTKGYKDGYRFYMQPSQARVQTIKNSSATVIEDIAYDKFKDGDVYYDAISDTHTFYVKGDAFPEEIAEAKGVSVSTREEPPVYKIEWIKKGGSMYITRDGNQIAKYEPENPEYTTGYLSLTCQSTEMAILDNVRASIFKVLETEEKEEMVASSLVLGEEIGGSISGTFKIKNYSGANEEICAVVAAYGADNQLMSATVMNLGELAAGGIEDIPFTINNVSSPQRVSLFLMDTLEKINQYGYYEFE